MRVLLDENLNWRLVRYFDADCHVIGNGCVIFCHSHNPFASLQEFILKIKLVSTFVFVILLNTQTLVLAQQAGYADPLLWSGSDSGISMFFTKKHTKTTSGINFSYSELEDADTSLLFRFRSRIYYNYSPKVVIYAAPALWFSNTGLYSPYAGIGILRLGEIKDSNLCYFFDGSFFAGYTPGAYRISERTIEIRNRLFAALEGGFGISYRFYSSKANIFAPFFTTRFVNSIYEEYYSQLLAGRIGLLAEFDKIGVMCAWRFSFTRPADGRVVIGFIFRS